MGGFPDIITRLPQADIPFEGVHAHLFQGSAQQMVFMRFDEDVEVPEHTHAAQWGVVLGGTIELIVAGEPRLLERGDTYVIPAGVPHRARIHAGYSDLTLFDQQDRYKTRESSR